MLVALLLSSNFTMEVDVRKDKTDMVLIDRSPQADPQDCLFAEEGGGYAVGQSRDFVAGQVGPC